MSGPYALLYADPPWRFEAYSRETGLERAPDKHYETMDQDALADLPVGSWALDDALLAMWVYDPMLPAALELANAWGFGFVTVLFRWFKTTDGQLRLFNPTPKPSFGLGYHTRGGACEECWLFKRGKGLPVRVHSIRKEFFAELREHSRKPDDVAEWLVQLYGDVPRVELFGRTRRPGWDVFGNEIDKFAPPKPPLLEVMGAA